MGRRGAPVVIFLLWLLPATVLLAICVFAGMRTERLADVSIFTVNSSLIGSNSKSPTIGSGGGGIPDFYSAHLLTTCYGVYQPDGTTPGAKKNVTHCTSPRIGSFDLAKAVNPNSTGSPWLEDGGFPDWLTDDLRALRPEYIVMVVCYVLAAVLVIVFLLMTLLAIFITGPPFAFKTALLALLSALALAAASGITTHLSMKARGIINRDSSATRISAPSEWRFLAISWAATALLLLSAANWFAESSHRKRNKLGTWVLVAMPVKMIQGQRRRAKK